MTDKIEQVYNAYKADGATKAASLQQFKNWMYGDNYRRGIYNDLREQGANVGTFEHFSQALGYRAKSNVAKAASNYVAPQKGYTIDTSDYDPKVPNSIARVTAGDRQGVLDETYLQRLNNKRTRKVQGAVGIEKQTGAQQNIGFDEKNRLKITRDDYKPLYRKKGKGFNSETMTDLGNGVVADYSADDETGSTLSIPRTDKKLNDDVSRAAEELNKQIVEENAKKIDAKNAEAWGNELKGSQIGSAAGGELMGLSIVKSANQKYGSSASAKEVLQQIVNGFVSDRAKQLVAKKASQLGVEPDALWQQMLYGVEKAVRDRYVEREMPKNDFEYVMRGISNSIIGNMGKRMALGAGDRDIISEGEQKYADLVEKRANEQGLWSGASAAKYGNIATGMATDALAFAGAGKAAGATMDIVGKGLNIITKTPLGKSLLGRVVGTSASELTKKYGAEGAARILNFVGNNQSVVGTLLTNGLKGTVQSGLTLGNYGAVQYMTGEGYDKLAKGEGGWWAGLGDSYWGQFKTGLKFGAVGAVGGAVGRGVGITGTEASILQKVKHGLTKATVSTGAFVAESLAFRTDQMAEEWARDNKIDFVDNLVQGACENLTIKLSGGHLGQFRPKNIIRGMLMSGKDARITLNDAEKREFLSNTNAKSFQAACEALNPDHKTEAERGEEGNKKSSFGDGEKNDAVDKMKNFLEDPNISLRTRQKVAAALGGVISKSVPRVTMTSITPNGKGKYTVKSYSRDNELLSVDEFNSKEKAEAKKQEILDRRADTDFKNKYVGAMHNLTQEDKKWVLEEAAKELGYSSVAEWEVYNALDKARGEDNPEKQKEVVERKMAERRGMRAKAVLDIQREVNEEYGVDIDEVMGKDPTIRKRNERGAIEEFSRRLNEVVVDKDDAEQQAEIASQSGAEIAEQADVNNSEEFTEASKQVNDRLNAATGTWMEIVKNNPDIEDYMKNNPDTDIMEMREMFGDEVADAYLELSNAQAAKDGFMNQTGQKIEAEVQSQVTQSIFQGKINGEEDKENVYLLTAGNGQSWTLVGGDVEIGEYGSVKVKDDGGVAIVRDENGNTVQLTNLEGLKAQRISLEEYSNTIRTTLQEQKTQEIQASERQLQTGKQSETPQAPKQPNKPSEPEPSDNGEGRAKGPVYKVDYDHPEKSIYVEDKVDGSEEVESKFGEKEGKWDKAGGVWDRLNGWGEKNGLYYYKYNNVSNGYRVLWFKDKPSEEQKKLIARIIDVVNSANGYGYSRIANDILNVLSGKTLSDDVKDAVIDCEQVRKEIISKNPITEEEIEKWGEYDGVDEFAKEENRTIRLAIDYLRGDKIGEDARSAYCNVVQPRSLYKGTPQGDADNKGATNKGRPSRLDRRINIDKRKEDGEHNFYGDKSTNSTRDFDDRIESEYLDDYKGVVDNDGYYVVEGNHHICLGYQVDKSGHGYANLDIRLWRKPTQAEIDEIITQYNNGELNGSGEEIAKRVDAIMNTPDSLLRDGYKEYVESPKGGNPPADGNNPPKGGNPPADGGEKMQFRDGTDVPMTEDGEPDFGKMTPEHGAELYKDTFGDDAEKMVDDEVKVAEKELKVAERMKISGKSWSEKTASKKAKDAAIEAARKKLEQANAIKKAMTAQKIADGMGNNGVGEVGQDGDTNERTARAKQRFETAPKAKGRHGSITLPSGEEIDGTYYVVSADGLTPTHDPFNHFGKHPDAPVDTEGRTLNDRDYEHDGEAQNTVLKHGSEYNGLAVDNVPVVLSNGLVVSGNERTMAGQIAAKNGTDKAYNEKLRKNAEGYGIKPEELDGIENGRLIFVPDKDMPYTTETFRKFNKPTEKRQGGTETAIANSKTLKPEEIGAIISEIEGSGSLEALFNNPKATTDLFKTLVEKGVIGQNEIAGYVDDQGKISVEGKELVKNLLIGAVFKPETIRMMGNDSALKTKVVSGIRAITENMKLGEYSLKEEIDEAVKLLAEARSHNMKVDELLRQQDAFGQNASERYSNMAQAIAQALEGSTTLFRDLVREYNDVASQRNTGEGNLFGEAQSKEDFVKEFVESSRILKENSLKTYGTEEEHPEGKGEDNVPNNAEPAKEGEGKRSAGAAKQAAGRGVKKGEQPEHPAGGETPTYEKTAREKYIEEHPITEEQIDATDASDARKEAAKSYLRGEDDSSLAKAAYRSVYSKIKTDKPDKPSEPPASGGGAVTEGPESQAPTKPNKHRERRNVSREPEGESKPKGGKERKPQSEAPAGAKEKLSRIKAIEARLKAAKSKGKEDDSPFDFYNVDVLTDEQNDIMLEYIEAGADLSYELLKDGAVKSKEDFKNFMRENLGEGLKDATGYSDKDVDDLFEDLWNWKYKNPETKETKRISDWAKDFGVTDNEPINNENNEEEGNKVGTGNVVVEKPKGSIPKPGGAGNGGGAVEPTNGHGSAGNDSGTSRNGNGGHYRPSARHTANERGGENNGTLQGGTKSGENGAELPHGGGGSKGANSSGKTGDVLPGVGRNALASIEKEKVPYQSPSDPWNKHAIGSVIPSGIASSVKKAFDKLVKEVKKNVTDFVRDELGYSSNEEMFGGLSSEQVDSVALAIHSMKKGKSFIIGDQTGVGKGRQAASLIRWAKKNGKKVIFVTESSKLFSDMYGDIQDIGSEYMPFTINNDAEANITDRNGKVVVRHPNAQTLNALFKSGTYELPKDRNGKQYDLLMMTYTQGSVTDKDKLEWIRQYAKDAIIVMDESHNASGASTRGKFFSELIDNAAGVTFLSATYAKRPDNMMIYAQRSSLADVNMSRRALIEAIKQYGVPMQEILADGLFGSGEMIRRERDMTGVKTKWLKPEEMYDKASMDKTRHTSDKTMELVNNIIDFQRTYVNPIVAAYEKELAQQNATAAKMGAPMIHYANTSYASQVSNIVNLTVYGLKAKKAAEMAIEQIKAGKKPVIAVENTMGSYVNDIEGSVASADFGRIFDKGIKFALRYTMFQTAKGADGQYRKVKGSEQVFDAYDELPDAGRRALDLIRKQIETYLGDTNIEQLSLSPIDMVKRMIAEAGYNCGEITGRTKQLVKNEDGSYSAASLSIKKKEAANRFNGGSAEAPLPENEQYDALILNTAGATGISLHASAKFGNTKQRTMIILQPSRDVNTEVQMRGRIDRTGQLHRGEYYYLTSPVPAEQKSIMMLKQKLASLDANSVGTEEVSSNRVEAEDMDNKYGNEVAKEFLLDHLSDINNQLETGQCLTFDNKTRSWVAPDNLLYGLLKGIQRLDCETQEFVINELATRYKDKIDYLNQNGINDLKSTTLNLEAVTDTSEIFIKGKDEKSPNVFAHNTKIERVEVNVLKKPLRSSDMQDRIKKYGAYDENGKLDPTYSDGIDQSLEEYRRARIGERQKKLDAALDALVEKQKEIYPKNEAETDEEYEARMQRVPAVKEMKQKNENTINQLRTDLGKQASAVSKAAIYLKPGMPCFVPLTDAIDEGAAMSYGRFLGFEKSKDGNPRSYKAVFAVKDSRAVISISCVNSEQVIRNIIENSRDMELREITKNKDTGDQYSWYEPEYQKTVDTWWDSKIPKNTNRQHRYMITGNILQACGSLGKYKGQIVTFTRRNPETGEVTLERGMLLAENFDPENFKVRTAVTKNDVWNRYDEIEDKASNITASRQGDTLVVTFKKQKGEKLVNHPVLQDTELAAIALKAGDGTAYSKGRNTISMSFAEKNAEKALELLYKNHSFTKEKYFVMPDSKDKPDRIVRTDKPAKEVIEELKAKYGRSKWEVAENINRMLKRYRMDVNNEELKSKIAEAVQLRQAYYREEYAQGSISKLGWEVLIYDERIRQLSDQMENAESDAALRDYKQARERIYNIRAAVIEEIESRGEGKGTPLHLEQGQWTAKKAKDLFDKLNTDEESKRIMDKVFEKIKDLEIQVVLNEKIESSVGGRAAGNVIEYNWKYLNAEYLPDQAKANTILHEMIHTVTAYADHLVEQGMEHMLKPEMVEAINDLHSILNAIKDQDIFKHDGARQYGLANVREMLAEAGSNESFRADLKKAGLWTRMLDGILRFFGIERSGAKKTNAYDSVMTRLEDLIEGFNEDTWRKTYAGTMYGGYSEQKHTPSSVRFRTSEELNNEYGDRWANEQTNEDGRHTTQVKNTINSYKKFGDWVKKDSSGKHVDVLDASSGLGLGTQWMRENGMTVDDVEPFPSRDREKPTFESYDAIDKKYDYIISNAVLNVIPDDWRANVLHDMASKLKDGGKLVINVRGAQSIKAQGTEGKTRITLDDPSEILVLRPDGSIKAYQKGFTKEELKKWCEKELGNGYSVEIANNKNAGGSYDTAVVVTKNNGNVRYRKIFLKEGETEESKRAWKAWKVGKGLSTEVRIEHFASDVENPEVRAALERGEKVKGWYDIKTGKVHLYYPNITDKYDAQKTVVHEVIGHKGMRGLLGEEGYKDMMRRIYTHMSDAEVSEVNRRMMQNGWDFYTAMDEYVADKAEDTVWNPEAASLWENVRHYVTEAIQKAGYRITPNVNDVKYWLWESKRGLKGGGAYTEMKRSSLLWKLDNTKPSLEEMISEDYKPGETHDSEKEEAIRYRKDTLDPQKDDTPLQSGTKTAIETELASKGSKRIECWVDDKHGLKVVQQHLGEGIKGGLDASIDPYHGAIAQSSIVREKQHQLQNGEIKKMDDEIRNCTLKLGGGRRAYEDLNIYAYVKSGLERNRVLYVRDVAGRVDQQVQKINKEIVKANPKMGKLTIKGVEEYRDVFHAEKSQLDADLRAGKINMHQYCDKMDKFIADHRFNYDGIAEHAPYIDELNKWYEENVAQKYDPDTNDYSGIMSIEQFQVNGGTPNDALIDHVMQIENTLGKESVDKLWDSVNGVTSVSLKNSYEYQNIDKAAYNRASSMFTFYLPMRGWKADTMEDSYTYMRAGLGSKGGSELRHAKGRTTLASSPFGTACSLANNSISRGEDNRNKQRLYRLVYRWIKEHTTTDNEGNSRLTEEAPVMISDVWYEKRSDPATGDEYWEAVSPDIKPGDSPAEIRSKVENFQATMEAAEALGNAKRTAQHGVFDKHFDINAHKDEHIVYVNIGGRQKMIIFPGNPRAAQAINGDLKSDKGTSKLMRGMAAMFTSYNITFSATNTSRDTVFANNNVAVRESREYWLKFTNNQRALLGGMIKGILALNAPKLRGAYFEMWNRYKNGVPPRNERERYFKEFMENGGKTGFVTTKTIKDFETAIRKNATEKRPFGVGAKEIFKAVPDIIEAMNERAENLNRFAAYLTSRQVGRSIMRSVQDAKEVSTNFNRRGAGSATFKDDIDAGKWEKFNGWLYDHSKSCYLFFNAGMQSLALLSYNIKHHPVRTAAYTVAVPMIFSSAIVPLVNAFLATSVWGEDDGDVYSNLPEWDRRNNLCLYAGKGKWVKVPLPIEIRAFYGLGDCALGMINGNYESTKTPAVDVLSQLTQALPLDFMGEGGDAIGAMLPDVMKPGYHIVSNKDWTGKPLYKRSRWNTYEPEWQKQFKGEAEWEVEASKWLNEMTGGGDHVKGWADGMWTTNPAVWDEIVSGYLGGAGSDAGRFVKLGSRAATGNWEDFSVREIPMVRALYSTPTERTQYYRVTNKYGKYKEQSAKYEHDLKSWGKSDNPMDKAHFYRDMNERVPELKQMFEIKKAEAKLKVQLNIANNEEMPDDVRKKAQMKAYQIKQDVVKKIEAGL